MRNALHFFVSIGWLLCSLVCVGCQPSDRPAESSTADSSAAAAAEGSDADASQPEETAGDTDRNAASSQAPEPAGLDRRDSAATRQAAASAATNTTEETRRRETAAEAPRKNQSEILSRPFATLQPLQTEDPEKLLEHLREIDAAIQDLVVAGSSELLNEEMFTEFGMRLGKMKLSTGQRLAAAPEATTDQQKTGKIAQLVALSHMSGLRDVQSAKQLERLAAELAQSDDADFAHQSRVVLLGFEIQALQNGLRSDPAPLVEQSRQLIARPEDRAFPEFMVLQQAWQVLQQMGFDESAEEVRTTLVEEYREANDPQLRGQAWLLEVESSQAYENYMLAFQALGDDRFDQSAALAAVRGLYDAFPTLSTLEQIASTVPNIEYSGQVALSQQIVEYVQGQLDNHPGADLGPLEQILQNHLRRTGLVGQPLQLEKLVAFDGEPIDWARFEDKVVLVDFWATWCLPCLKELPNIRETYSELVDEGFEVLSVNMDENLSSARQFVERQDFPWTTFHAADPSRLGFKSEFAGRLGINAIPFMILVGRDGTVQQIHVRGEKLKPAVQALLGSPGE